MVVGSRGLAVLRSGRELGQVGHVGIAVRDKLGRVLEDDVVGAGLPVEGCGAERGLVGLLLVAVGVDVGVIVGGTHCVGCGKRMRRVLLDDDWGEGTREPRGLGLVRAVLELGLARCRELVVVAVVVDDVVDDDGTRG